MKGEFEMSMMGELSFFLGIQIKQRKDGIFINQAKYIKENLKKFGLENVKPQATPMSSSIKLDKDEEGKCVDSKLYRSMIGSLLYLTASRPDIMFSVCLCARFQANPKESHLKAVKRIFRYLQDTPSLGLWYPRDSTFDLHAYSDADYGGCKIDRKSTSGTCQFLGNMLISWFSKKQNSVALSTTEAEYISAGSCCAQVLWMKQQLLDYGIDVGTIPIKISSQAQEYRYGLHRTGTNFVLYRYEFSCFGTSFVPYRMPLKKRHRTDASSSSNPNGAKPNLTIIYGESFNDPNNSDAMENFKEFEHYRIRRERRPQMSFLTSSTFNFRYLAQLRDWKLLPYLRLSAKEEIVAVESYLMRKTFQINPKVIATALGIEDMRVTDEGPQRHNPLGSVRDLDAHDRFLHFLITWCFRPSGGKWSTIRNVDSFWLNCFRQNIRPNLARIIFIEIVDLVRDRHLVSVKSFTYGTALSHIFEKLKIDCSADLAIPLTDPINDKSLRKAKFTLFGGQWVKNNELPHGVQAANAEDAP
ncbi:hypothetical protein V6N11_022180 [Hibiscus sabdariffa]|uniref:Reverse transcriptase Ty1/copia-type domain-containing protein n=1 Tax=Hibiscus sabdariffa TaxID=183260 RepID=A0ABR2TIE4_9ROSI